MGLMKLATAFAAGAFAMYMLDPETGRRRRAMVRDKAVAAGHDAQRLARGASRRTSDKLRGAAAEMRSQMGDATPGDRQLHERIRSELGRLVGQPGQVEARVNDGLVTLSGSVQSAEMDRLIAAVSAIPGVRHVDNRLSVGAMPSGAPGSQPPTGGRMH
ncbi:MAG TPA: BON domain-containing protein [Rhodanobacteraceae bacterium]|jgi:osmotically-inducible protein OsmY|nr:BON domain-containing protein [Rhodanobacteraceae bacterium]